jgi:hypothetical protein
MSAVQAMKHEKHLTEANKAADAFRELAEIAGGFEHDAYRLAYAFYAGVSWEKLTDRERLAFLMWQEGITP